MNDHNHSPHAQQSAPDPERGARLSQHPHPSPLLRRVTAITVALGLAGLAFGVVGLIVVGVWQGLPLLPLMAPFLAVMALPLLQLAVMHPTITVYERGLWLQPVLGPGAWVRWDAVIDVADHTLIHRALNKRGERERDGRLIVVERGLPGVYRVVGGMAGLGWRTRAFGIATHAHVDYKTLLNAIQRHKRRT